MMTKIPYVQFMKHAQKVVKSPACKVRPILGGVIHCVDYIAVTDSHRLYYATDMYDGEEKNVDPSTGEEITDGNYPDVTRLIPDADSAKFTTKINVESTAKAVKLIEQAGKVEKATDIITINKDIGDVVFATHERSLINCRYIAGNNAEGEAVNLSASAKYISEAFALLKDAGLSEVTFNYYGAYRPFTFTGGNLTVLILPIREMKGSV